MSHATMVLCVGYAVGNPIHEILFEELKISIERSLDSAYYAIVR